MSKRFFMTVGSLALAALPRLAAAQDEAPTSPPPPVLQPAPPPDVCPPGTSPVYRTEIAPAPVAAPRKTADFAPYQLALSTGGGVGNFVRDRISDNTGPVAGVWDVRMLAGTRSFVAFEGAYEGTSQGIDGTLSGEGGNITTTQVAGSLRFNMTRARVQPFVAAGGGWINLHRTSGTGITDGTSFAHNDNAFVAPFAGGIATYLGRHGMLDVRGAYNLVATKDFSNSGARPDMWNAELRFGYAF
jgi:hypothetical protein